MGERALNNTETETDKKPLRINNLYSLSKILIYSPIFLFFFVLVSF